MSLLILSGFEANGMAGLLADDRLANGLNIPAAAIATGQTAQTASALMHASATDPNVMQQQLSSLNQPPSVIKIGAVFDVATAQVIANWLSTLPHRPTVVLDPVGLSSGDHRPLSTMTLGERLAPLLPWVSLLTPNTDEAKALAGTTESVQILRVLQAQYDFRGTLLLKGGHSVSEQDDVVTDELLVPDDPRRWQLQQPKRLSKLRGTGCRLSTAIACALTDGYALTDACVLGSAVLHRYWRLAPKPTAPGWPDTLSDYPVVSTDTHPTSPDRTFPALDWPSGLYPVVDSAQWVQRLANTGIRTLQLRIKHARSDVLSDQIRQAIEIANAHQLQLFINDHWQQAIELGAYGVHLGQEDLDTADLAAIANAGLRLGISTHGDTELLRALALKPSYLAVGAVFPTQTKDMSGQIQGIGRLRRYVRLSKGTPVVAIGGINVQNLADVLDTNVDMVAVVSAVTASTAPERDAHLLNERVMRCRH
ncbi:thiamine phosphate synthase [Reinekea blandensis]|uniref:Thiamine-phosphate synthase n=1 Tax=Reinekea blandensis MED297 TaxID=314283 RepID=A4BCN5_9GAMM|nr:thiamine phosphate synthase [Reinekea blandensis]EAR09967.1 Thiamine monophosphate synthase [Reinekea sp. MED297] [Reinekea blandensis MED297]